VFEGPLDLLLHLIEREELDITRVSLAMVADQYLDYMAVLQEVAAANLADFLVIAARLLLIKSRALLPPPETPPEEEEEDVAEELAQQLLEYRRFKDVAAQLREIEQTERRAYPRLAPPPQLQRPPRWGEASPGELLAALKRVLEAHPPAPPVDEVVAPMTVRIADCIILIAGMMRQHRRLRFSALMQRARSRLEVIVIFMAMLEMIKQQRLRAVQEQSFAEIYVEAREPDPEEALPPADLSEYGEDRPG
jgi:segregation and condensation protein A